MEYPIRLSPRGFDVHDPSIGEQIVYSSHSRAAARMVAEALSVETITRRDATRLPSDFSELRAALAAKEA